MWDALQRPRLGENVCVMVALFYFTLAGRGGSLLTYPGLRSGLMIPPLRAHKGRYRTQLWFDEL
jgi:hypothetical protein